MIKASLEGEGGLPHSPLSKKQVSLKHWKELNFIKIFPLTLEFIDNKQAN